MSSSWLLQPWPLLGRGTPGFTSIIYSMEFPGRLCCLSCKTSPYCFARHVEEKPWSFLSDPKRKTLSEETNLGTLQNLAPAPHWTHGMVLWCPMNSNTCAKDLRSCSLNQMHTFTRHSGRSFCLLRVPLSSFVDLCGKSWQWWWHCALFCGGPHWGSNPLWSRFCNSGHRLIPVPPHGVKINFYPPPVMSFSLSLTSKSQWCTFEIDLKLTALLVDVAWKEKSQNKFTKYQQVIKSLEACNKTCTSIANSRNKEMWYMIILIYLIVSSDCWMVLHVQSCAHTVTATHLVMGEPCQKMCRKQKKHGDHKEIEHGLESMLSGLPISCNILKYRTSKNRKRTRRWMKPMVQFLCL